MERVSDLDTAWFGNWAHLADWRSEASDYATASHTDMRCPPEGEDVGKDAVERVVALAALQFLAHGGSFRDCHPLLRTAWKGAKPSADRTCKRLLLKQPALGADDLVGSVTDILRETCLGGYRCGRALRAV